MGTLKIDGKLSVGLNNSDSMACGYGLHVHDLRNATITPNSFGDQAVNYYFDEEVNGDWKGIMHFKGWSGSYAAWQIAAQASNSADNTNSLYFRTGINNTWNNWHTLLDNYNYTSYTVTKTGSGASGTWGINVNGNAATSSRLLNTYYISGDNHSLALKAAFDTYKDSIPRNELSTYYSSAYGNGSMYMGYFLSGYDSTPYGGFYVAHYDTPYYVGI